MQRKHVKRNASNSWGQISWGKNCNNQNGDSSRFNELQQQQVAENNFDF